MAGRKKRPPEVSERLSFGPPMLAPPAGASPKDRDTADHVTGTTGGAGTIDEALAAEVAALDDYDDPPGPVLVDPPRRINVIVEAVRDGFEVSRLRDNGTTVACVMWTRAELIELAGRIASALEM